MTPRAAHATRAIQPATGASVIAATPRATAAAATAATHRRPQRVDSSLLSSEPSASWVERSVMNPFVPGDPWSWYANHRAADSDELADFRQPPALSYPGRPRRARSAGLDETRQRRRLHGR